MERVSDDLMSQWSRAGHEVTCFTTPGSGMSAREYELIEVPGKPGRYSALWRRRVARLVLRESWDIIFSVSAAAHGCLARQSSYPVVMQAHGTAWNELRTKVRSVHPVDWLRAAAKLIGLIRDLINYPRYARIISVNASVRSALDEVPFRRFAAEPRLIENGVAAGLGSARREQTETDAAPRIGFVGRLHREKNARVVVELGTELGWPTKIIGGGPELKDLQGLSGHSVTFLGSLDHGSVLEELRQLDVLIVPSLHREGLTLTVLEALAQSVPVVISPQIAEAMTDLPAGVIRSATDTASMREAVFRARLLRPELPADRSLVYAGNKYISLFEELVQ
ncbi:glycosyltransferase family 4 protein [Curtobacterium citreum]